jgi:NADH dehydrogenase
VERDAPAEVVLDVAGPDVTTTREVVELLEKLTGKSPVHLPVPEFLAKLGTQAAGALGVQSPVTDDQITMLLEENVIRPGRTNALTETFGVTPLTLGEGLGKLLDPMPERLPQEGTGKLEEQRYWADIRGSALPAEALFERFRARFGDFAPDALLEVGAEPGTPRAMEEGATMTLGLPLRGNIQVRVVEAAERRITCVTLHGHPLSGAIRFEAAEPAPGLVRFEVRSYTRSSGVVDYVGMKTVGKVAQRSTWRTVVDNVVAESGGEAPDGVQDESRTLEGDEAEAVERWVEELVMARRRAESPSGPGEPPGDARAA